MRHAWSEAYLNSSKAAAAPTRRGPAPASPAPTASRFRNRTRSAKLWVPVQGEPPSCWAEFLRRAQLQSVDELRAGDLPSRRPHPRRAALHPAVPGLGAGADVGRSAGDAGPPDQAGFDTGGTDGRVGNDTMQAIHDSRSRRDSRPPTAMAAWRCWRGCGRRIPSERPQPGQTFSACSSKCWLAGPILSQNINRTSVRNSAIAARLAADAARKRKPPSSGA